MPASLIEDMSSTNSAAVDQRAFQIALELSMLGLSQPGQPEPSQQAGGVGNGSGSGAEDGGGTSASSPTNSASSNSKNNTPFNLDSPEIVGGESKGGPLSMKRSANMTECVPVPSSEHVAEIVGRQGCKIKALRAKTNTYIKTPVRGEEPVFVVTGRKEDVGAAKREILSAAEHFSQIRASRRNNNTSGTGGPLTQGPPSPNAPGQITIQVRVPYRVVGLVVGPKGATIKRIQQQTRTYIVTPSREKEPVFEVTGTPENVDKARQEIESHIALRTGGLVDANNGVGNGSVPPTPGLPSQHTNGDDNDFHSNGIDSGFHDFNNEMLNSIYKPPSSNSAFTSYNSALNASNNFLSHIRHHNRTMHQPNDNHPNIFNFSPMALNVNANLTAKMNEYSPPSTNGFTNGFGFYENEQGIGSPSFDAGNISMWQDGGDHCKLPNNGTFAFNAPNAIGVSDDPVGGLPRRTSSLSSSTTPRLSPSLTDSSSNAQGGSPGSVASPETDHPSMRRIRSDPLSGGLASIPFAPLSTSAISATPGMAFSIVTTSNTSLSSSNNSVSSSPTDSTGSSAGLNRRKNCLICNDGGVVAALVPCGHNLFCMECANSIVDKPEDDRRCPVCQQLPTQAIRIFS